MKRFSWIHLSDLHFGLSGQPSLWPNVKLALFDDLPKLHDRTGPWHIVMFTGDLVQQGRKDEFAALETKVLGPLWERLKELGSQPTLLAVPGNHDLERPDSKKQPAGLRQLLRKDGFREIEEEFFSETPDEYRAIINNAFTNYVDWWNLTRYANPNVRQGLLPGEFSVTLEVDDVRIGVVGLNTTFLQLAGGDYEGRLAWNVQQFNAACTGDAHGDGPDWVRDHEVCLLIAHQGPEWLDNHSRENVYPEINPAGRFGIHLFGHMHENVVRGTSFGAGVMIRQWQGNSLFGLEKFGDPPRADRRHGYSAGTIEFEGTSANLRHWPRKAVMDRNGWRFERDSQSCILDENDGGTKPATIAMQRRDHDRPTGRTDSAKNVPTLRTAERLALDEYTLAARKLWDIVDLAGLPEDDRHLAMQRFLLRQLFIPLRLIVEASIKEQ
jgi:hypothetical protein